MRRLWVQLTLAFIAVTLASVAAAALLANRRTSDEFRGFLAQSQVQESGLSAELAAHYQTRGSWDGVEQVFAAWRGPGGMGGGHGMMRGMPMLVLADRDGVVVYTSAGAPGARLDSAERDSALPIVADGAPVGFLVVHSMAQAGMTAAAERFLDQVNQALLQAGLIGALLGALLGLLLARGLAAPLDRLAAAARLLARGDLSQRVPVRGPAEVAAAGLAFNEMAGALEDAEGLRRRMVADIAHELRTPLAVIQGNLQAILDDVYPLEKAEVQTILDETLLLGRLVDDLRELALAEAGQLRLQPQPVDAAALVAQAAAPFEGLAAEKGVALTVAAPTGLPPVQADPDRAGQVLRNLVANALRHTPQGGTITLKAERRTLNDAAEAWKASSRTPKPESPCSASILFSVADTGPGIAPDDLPQVFERFWRADRSRARAQGGSGLGLAIARQLVQAQGGEIGVASADGQGSCFWFTLPLAPKPGEDGVGSDPGSGEPRRAGIDQ
jgi:two-component system OmpR family sensor kinase/two-component system sensor histidine kinase BaeS